MINTPYTVADLKRLLANLDDNLPIVIHDADYNRNLQVDAFSAGTKTYHHNGTRKTEHCLLLESLYGGIGLKTVEY